MLCPLIPTHLHYSLSGNRTGPIPRPKRNSAFWQGPIQIDRWPEKTAWKGGGPLLVRSQKLAVHRPADRQVCIVPHKRLEKLSAGANFYVEELCCGCLTGVHAPEVDGMLLDLGVVLLAGVSAAESAMYASGSKPEALDCGHPDLRGLAVTTGAGKICMVVANFADEPLVYGGVEIPGHKAVIL